MKYFSDNNLLHCSQYGYRCHHSTEHAALELIDRINNCFIENGKILGIFLDLSKAFDTIDYTILLAKLKHYGFQPGALALIENYLHNRKQFVQIDDVKSGYLNLETGIPQGSILGPLFIIYMNDLRHASKKSDLINYADDSTFLMDITKFGKNDHIISTRIDRFL